MSDFHGEGSPGLTDLLPESVCVCGNVAFTLDVMSEIVRRDGEWDVTNIKGIGAIISRLHASTG